MEHELTVNLLPWREKKARRHKYAKALLATSIIILTLIILFFIYQKEEKIEQANIAKIEKPQFKKAFHAKKEWAFLAKLFSIISNKLPKQVTVSNLSQEEGEILLKATMQNPKKLSSFLISLKKELPNTSIKLTHLSEKPTLLFTISIIPIKNPGELAIKLTPFDFSTWSSAIAARARQENLLIELKPTELGAHLELQGNYKNLIYFLFQLKRSQWPVLLNAWQLKPYQKNLMLDVTLEVVHQ